MSTHVFGLDKDTASCLLSYLVDFYPLLRLVDKTWLRSCKNSSKPDLARSLVANGYSHALIWAIRNGCPYALHTWFDVAKRAYLITLSRARRCDRSRIFHLSDLDKIWCAGDFGRGRPFRIPGLCKDVTRCVLLYLVDYFPLMRFVNKTWSKGCIGPRHPNFARTLASNGHFTALRWAIGEGCCCPPRLLKEVTQDNHSHLLGYSPAYGLPKKQ